MAILWVALGGALGATARYGTALVVASIIKTTPPVGTWTANLLGSFVIGVLLPIVVRPEVPQSWRLFAIVGFLGAYTTFSSFSLESIQLLQEQAYGWFLANALGTVFVGLGCVWAGLWVGRWLSGA